MKQIFFKDFIKLQRGHDLPRKEMVEGPYPVVGSTSIIGWHNEFKYNPPGVVTGRSGSLGVIQYIKKRYWPHNTALWVKDFKGNLPRYVYYFLQSIDLMRFNSGAGVPTLNRNDLDSLEISIHYYENQVKITSILSAYDNLIENNTRRIEILEEMAQRIYQEWFVHFRFPGHENVKMVDSELGEIPEEWQESAVCEIYSILPGFAFKSSYMGEKGEFGIVKIKNIQPFTVDLDNIQFISRETINTNILNFSLDAGDLLIAMTGAQVGKIGIMPRTNSSFLLNQRVGKFIPKLDFLKGNQFIYQIVKSNAFQTNVYNIAQGAAQPNISGSQIEGIKIVLPPFELIKKFEDFCEPLRDLVLNLQYRCQILRNTRDFLLPKLISGQIDVDKLDIDIGAIKGELQ